MCGSYGLGGYLHRGEEPDDALPPLDQREAQAAVAQWAREWCGKASTSRTRKDGRTNLHPLIVPDDDGRELAMAWWWLHRGGKPVEKNGFNARDDALLSSWKSAFQRRALIPASWYAEGGQVFRLPGGGQFGIAAITAPRTVDGGETISYSMVTREGVGEAASVRTARGDSRMPLVLPRELHDTWLDPERPGDAELVDLVQAASEEISRAMTTSAPPDEPAAPTLF